MWKPDEGVLEEARAVLLDWIASVGEDPVAPDRRVGEALSALEAAGTLSLMGLAGEVDAYAEPRRERLATEVATALEELDPASLDEAASTLLTRAPDLELDEDEDALAELEEELVEALSARDRAELVLEGARRVLAREPELSVELEASILGFDEALRPELYRLLPLGSRRAAMAAWAEPSQRSRLWWWHRGAGLPHTALRDLGTAAWVIRVFPEARAELERLVEADGLIESMAEDLRAAPVQTRAGPVAVGPRQVRFHASLSALAADTGGELGSVAFERGVTLELVRLHDRTIAAYLSDDAEVLADGDVAVRWSGPGGEGHLTLSGDRGSFEGPATEEQVAGLAGATDVRVVQGLTVLPEKP